ncbi:MAG TPA: lipopolysaccharide heptosyltransferase II [Bryobacteraceae bacterium]|nr:lipopolysaccharide heptosyltransferase II [Bryobacteraceae bacterium]
MQYGRILVRATNWVGDAVMSVPALQQLRRSYPEAHIAILAMPSVAGLYGRESFCDELIPYELPRGARGFAEKWKLARELRARNFDCALLLQNSFEAAVLVWLAGIPERIGYARDCRGIFLTRSVSVPKPGDIPTHQRFYYLEVLRRAHLLDNYTSNGDIRLGGKTAAAIEGRKRFGNASVKSPVIGISPGAAYGGAKRWLPERFAEAAIRVAEERAASIAVFGSPEELSICETVRERIEAFGRPCVNFAGLTTLAQFIELAAACDVFLANDSGPMHIASALGVPTVAIFGATDDQATGPTGELSTVVRHPVDCSPCLLRECPIDHRCMTRVSATIVADAALSLMGTPKN